MRVDEARQQQAVGELGYGLGSVPGPNLGERATVSDPAVGGDQQPGVGVGSQGPAAERVLRRVEYLGAIDRYGRAPSVSRSNVLSRSAATLTAIVAGSLPLISGSPIGVLIRAIVSVS